MSGPVFRASIFATGTVCGSMSLPFEVLNHSLRHEKNGEHQEANS
jgi:hypothetical protein